MVISSICALQRNAYQRPLARLLCYNHSTILYIVVLLCSASIFYGHNTMIPFGAQGRLDREERIRHVLLVPWPCH